MSQYRVDLDIFAGPMDLLLYLVRKDEVDIYDIPIARITEAYLRHVEILKMLDIDLAGDFLVMAATLMEIKSAMLLPRPEEAEDAAEDLSDPRIELVRQLLEYKKFKDAANLLQGSAEDRAQRFTRPDAIIEGLKDDTEPEIDLEQVSIWTLLEAFDEMMKATGRLHSFDHIKDDTPIDLYQIEILHRLQTEGPMTLEQIFQGRDNRLVIVGLFLALLELIRDRLIWAEQPDRLGPIYLRPLTDEPAEQAVQNAIYASAVAEEEFTAEAETDATSAPNAQPAEVEQVDDSKTLPAIAIQEIPHKQTTSIPEPAKDVRGDHTETDAIAIHHVPDNKQQNSSEDDTSQLAAQQADRPQDEPIK